MNKKKLLLMIGMIFLICFSFIFSRENFNGFILGDYIFSKLGIPTMSNGADGFHYTAFVSLTLLIIGVISLGKIKKELNISTSKLIIIFITFSILYPPIFKFSYEKIKGHSQGLNSIYYLREDSDLKITVENGIQIIQGSFIFHNYSNKDKSFFVKVLASDKEKLINPHLNLSHQIIFPELENQIIIPPESEKIVVLNTKVPAINELPIGSEYSSFDISIFDNENSVNFIKNKY